MGTPEGALAKPSARLDELLNLHIPFLSIKDNPKSGCSYGNAGLEKDLLTKI